MKRNLLIHNPTNIYTNGIDGKTYYRDYNLFWDELTDKLKKLHNVKLSLVRKSEIVLFYLLEKRINIRLH
jgi:hypothetical protein